MFQLTTDDDTLRIPLINGRTIGPDDLKINKLIFWSKLLDDICAVQEEEEESKETA